MLERVLVGDNLHEELIKRATDLASFLCRQNEFPSKISHNINIVSLIDRIWESSQNKHETIKRAIYDFFENLTFSMSFDALDRLFSFISQIKDYNEMNIKLLYKLTENAL